MKPIRAAIYGSCHAGALQRLLESDPHLSSRLQFIPLASCMDVTAEGIAALKTEMGSIDLFIYQNVSSDYRGAEYSSAEILRSARSRTEFLSFSYYHFESYTPFVLAPAASFPKPPSEYVDYLLGALIHHGLTDPQVVDALRHFEGFGPFAPALHAAAFSELRSRETRVLEGDRPIDIRLADRVEQAFRTTRLGHTVNHPTAAVFGWLANDVVAELGVRFGLDVADVEAANPDPLEDTSYSVAPFVSEAFDLAFQDEPAQRLDGERMSLDAYAAHERAYFEAIPGAAFFEAVGEMAIARPWLESLLEAPPLRRGTGAGRQGSRSPDLTLRFDQGSKPSALGQGWSLAEPTGIWSDGHLAAISIDAPRTLGAAWRLQLTAMGFAAPGVSAQRVEVSAQGEVLATWRVRPNIWMTYEVVLPASVFEDGEAVQLSLAMPDAAVAGGDDPRRLGIAIQELRGFL